MSPEPRWLAPPSYKLLAETVLASIERTAAVHSESDELEIFVKGVRASIVSVLRPVIPDFGITQPISCAFSWNARHMKRHIKRVIDWVLDNYLLHNEEIIRRQATAGLSQKWLWKASISSSDITAMAEHHVLEAFYFDDTRQLRPQFRLSSSNVTQLLKAEKLEEALEAVEEYAEMAGLFDCAFNYLTKRHSSIGTDQLVHTNILIRICQLAGQGGGTNVASATEFLSHIGYDVSLDEVRFLIISLAQNEFLVFHRYGSALTIDDCQFYLSMFGKVLLAKVLMSTTYFAQAFILAELPDEGLAREFQERRFSSNWEWIAGCVFNGVIAYNIFSRFERMEERVGKTNGVDFHHFRIQDQLKDRLSKEGGRILSIRRRKVIEEKEIALSKLIDIQRRHEEFDISEEIWK